jgi:hypothetical protein
MKEIGNSLVPFTPSFTGMTAMIRLESSQRSPNTSRPSWLLLGVSLLVGGCSICETGYIDDYATVGGKWQRAHPTQGRVGSPFSDSGHAGAIGQGRVGVADQRTDYGYGSVHPPRHHRGLHDEIIVDGMEVDGFETYGYPNTVIELGDDW